MSCALENSINNEETQGQDRGNCVQSLWDNSTSSFASQTLSGSSYPSFHLCRLDLFFNFVRELSNAPARDHTLAHATRLLKEHTPQRRDAGTSWEELRSRGTFLSEVTSQNQQAVEQGIRNIMSLIDGKADEPEKEKKSEVAPRTRPSQRTAQVLSTTQSSPDQSEKKSSPVPKAAHPEQFLTRPSKIHEIVQGKIAFVRSSSSVKESFLKQAQEAEQERHRRTPSPVPIISNPGARQEHINRAAQARLARLEQAKKKRASSEARQQHADEARWEVTRRRIVEAEEVARLKKDAYLFRHVTRYRTWASLVYTFSRTQYLLAEVKKHRAKRRLGELRTHGRLTAPVEWRLQVEAELLTPQAAQEALNRQLLQFMVGQRHDVKAAAAGVMLEFLRHIKKTGHMITSLRRYRFSVIRAEAEWHARSSSAGGGHITVRCPSWHHPLGITLAPPPTAVTTTPPLCSFRLHREEAQAAQDEQYIKRGKVPPRRLDFKEPPRIPDAIKGEYLAEMLRAKRNHSIKEHTNQCLMIFEEALKPPLYFRKFLLTPDQLDSALQDCVALAEEDRLKKAAQLPHASTASPPATSPTPSLLGQPQPPALQPSASASTLPNISISTGYTDDTESRTSSTQVGKMPPWLVQGMLPEEVLVFRPNGVLFFNMIAPLSRAFFSAVFSLLARCGLMLNLLPAPVLSQIFAQLNVNTLINVAETSFGLSRAILQRSSLRRRALEPLSALYGDVGVDALSQANILVTGNFQHGILCEVVDHLLRSGCTVTLHMHLPHPRNRRSLLDEILEGQAGLSDDEDAGIALLHYFGRRNRFGKVSLSSECGVPLSQPLLDKISIVGVIRTVFHFSWLTVTDYSRDSLKILGAAPSRAGQRGMIRLVGCQGNPDLNNLPPLCVVVTGPNEANIIAPSPADHIPWTDYVEGSGYALIEPEQATVTHQTLAEVLLDPTEHLNQSWPVLEHVKGLAEECDLPARRGLLHVGCRAIDRAIRRTLSAPPEAAKQDKEKPAKRDRSEREAPLPRDATDVDIAPAMLTQSAMEIVPPDLLPHLDAFLEWFGPRARGHLVPLVTLTGALLAHEAIQVLTGTYRPPPSPAQLHFLSFERCRADPVLLPPSLPPPPSPGPTRLLAALLGRSSATAAAAAAATAASAAASRPSKRSVGDLRCMVVGRPQDPIVSEILRCWGWMGAGCSDEGHLAIVTVPAPAPPALAQATLLPDADITPTLSPQPDPVIFQVTRTSSSPAPSLSRVASSSRSLPRLASLPSQQRLAPARPWIVPVSDMDSPLVTTRPPDRLPTSDLAQTHIRRWRRGAAGCVSAMTLVAETAAASGGSPSTGLIIAGVPTTPHASLREIDVCLCCGTAPDMVAWVEYQCAVHRFLCVQCDPVDRTVAPACCAASCPTAERTQLWSWPCPAPSGPTSEAGFLCHEAPSGRPRRVPQLPDPLARLGSEGFWPYLPHHALLWARALFGRLFYNEPAAVQNALGHPHDYREAHLTMQDAPEFADFSTVLQNSLYDVPHCFADCLAWARRVFERYFGPTAEPGAERLGTREPRTWQTDIRRTPRGVVFAPTHPAHCGFLWCAARLRATLYGLADEPTWSFAACAEWAADHSQQTPAGSAPQSPPSQPPRRAVGRRPPLAPSTPRREEHSARYEQMLSLLKNLPAMVLAFGQQQQQQQQQPGVEGHRPTLTLSPVTLDAYSQLHLDFLGAAARLRAQQFEVPEVRGELGDHVWIREVLFGVAPPLPSTTVSVLASLAILHQLCLVAHPTCPPPRWSFDPRQAPALSQLPALPPPGSPGDDEDIPLEILIPAVDPSLQEVLSAIKSQWPAARTPVLHALRFWGPTDEQSPMLWLGQFSSSDGASFRAYMGRMGVRASAPLPDSVLVPLLVQYSKAAQPPEAEAAATQQPVSYLDEDESLYWHRVVVLIGKPPVTMGTGIPSTFLRRAHI
ncbi:hypothetical protein PAPYR_80 [Paratrimastix pyriformis]|uniref:F-box domain-containing protein n=1 Tax=Paratrimastix pyriformis TaxID=342808 RepID=A0ABQ8UZ89_9EUKA|nr:hypothetical protein PAPYR_80 [Paratrimastix pyriformis]